MKLDTGFNVLTLPFEVKTLAAGSHDFRFLSCDLKF